MSTAPSIKRSITLFILAFCLMIQGGAQSGLYMVDTTTLSVSAGDMISVDSLVLQPSSAFTFNGPHTLVRNTALVHPSATRSISRIFKWDATLPPFNGAITIYYTVAELNGLSESGLTLNVHDGTDWNAFPLNASQNLSVHYVKTTSLSNLLMNELTLAARTEPLPLQWGTVTARRSLHGGSVSWTTYDEYAIDHFGVESSTEGIRWKTVAGMVSASNTPGRHGYTVTDPSLTAVKTYYRIRLVDADGKISYSEIAIIPALSGAGEMVIYPNPVQHLLTISTSSGTALNQVRIYDAAGRLVMQKSVEGNTVVSLSLDGMAQGIYTVQALLVNGTAEHRSFIKN